MTIALPSAPTFDNSFARELSGLYEIWSADTAPTPRLIALNEPLAIELGFDPGALRETSGIATLIGNIVPEGATPIAQAYAGHQFGGFSPRLGDGRALLLGEIVDRDGCRRDVHLKGSGRTPFSRGGDGKAVIGPMLREYIISESLHALGIPTSRSLAVTATGELARRETMVPGAVLTRVAASHLRVGSFQYAAASQDPTLLTRLANYAIDRHYPQARETENPYLDFFERVIDGQASLIARWMSVGFIHGVMNTDNMTISGESIDFGPCAFMDAFDPATVFSSIDHGGRYAYGNQPQIAQWNLARLGETLLPLISNDDDAAIALATDALRSFTNRYHEYWTNAMADKLGLDPSAIADPQLIDDFVGLLASARCDVTNGFRTLAEFLRGNPEPAVAVFKNHNDFHGWEQRWQQQLPDKSREEVARSMDRANPLYIPRNHLVEAALADATNNDLTAFEALLERVRNPFDEVPGMGVYAQPAPDSFSNYQTFCGT